MNPKFRILNSESQIPNSESQIPNPNPTDLVLKRFGQKDWSKKHLVKKTKKIWVKKKICPKKIGSKKMWVKFFFA